MSEQRTPWNKGKKSTIKYKYYTDGNKNIRIPEKEEPPNGFVPGRTLNYTDEAKKRQVEKTKQTKLDRYGSASYNNAKKATLTKQEKYGAGQNFEKIKQVNLEKYGVENPFAAKEVKEKIKNTMLDRYGVTNISKSADNKSKIKNTWRNKSQEQLQDIYYVRAKTNLEKYGVKNSAQANVVKEKMKKTCQQKYGVPYFCMTQECKKHSSNNSAPNTSFEDKLLENSLDFEREFNIENKSFDFKLSNSNILIEINPTATHNSTWGIFNKPGLSKNYHYDKSELAKLYKFRCIHVFDWDDKEKIINLLMRKKSIFARKCEIKEISTKDANNFLDKYHLQNSCKSSVQIGLFYKDDLVSVMTFGKPRYTKKYDYELLRFASNINVIGGANKLFSYFLRKYNAESIISYCDFSKFTGDVYKKLNFIYDGCTIGKHWYNPKTKTHITDNLLRQLGFDKLLGKEYGTFGKGSSNEELMKRFGFVEIYDAGQGKYIFSK